jgi:hypothetical protein
MKTCVGCDMNFLQRKAELIISDGEHICTDCRDLKQDRNRAKYWNGSKNKAIRYWFYIKQGIAVLNEVRNLFFIVFGAIFTFREQYPILNNIGFVVGIFAVSFLILFVVGFIFTHHVNKVADWLQIQFSTHWGRYQYTLLEEIRDAIKAKHDR